MPTIVRGLTDRTIAKYSDDYNDLLDEQLSDAESSSEQDERPAKRRRVALSHISVSQTAYPRSAYEGYTPRFPESCEANAISDLEDIFRRVHASDDEQPEHIIFELDQFDIYLPDSSLRHKGVLVTLDRLQNKNGYGEFVLNGVLSCGGAKHYVADVPFTTLTLEGYGDPDVFTMRDGLCVQSKKGAKGNVWYRLAQPSREYRRFYEPFVWLATFAKQFVDYLLERPKVILNDFRRRFREWLDARYAGDEHYVSWLDECRNMKDFRTTVSAHVGFLLKEAHSIDPELRLHPIWREIYPWDLTAVPHQPERENLTVVTPFVYECFRRMYFRDHLETRMITDRAVLGRIVARKSALDLSPFSALGCSRAPKPSTVSSMLVHPGDVVTVAVETQGPWKGSSGVAYAYVQAIRRLPVKTVLDIIWLYEPSDTTLRKAYYPFPNELFMSDNCECGRTAIDLECVTGTIDVTWSPKHPESVTGLFIRQTYRTNPKDNTYDFVTLRQAHFTCDCAERISVFEDCRRKYQIGDTVLVRQRDQQLFEDTLEPALLVDFDFDRKRVILRRFERKMQVGVHARSNELVLTDEVLDKAASKIVRKCFVRSFQPSLAKTDLPSPYNRNGAGDFYFIRSFAEAGGEALKADTFGASDLPMEQGPALEDIQSSEKLIGMGLFCGGGNFDRGLKEGGAVHFKYAVDYAKTAIHTYRANIEEGDNVKLFYGSVDDYLGQAMQGLNQDLIAQPADVDFICGGSPCPGFSDLQKDKGSFESLRNASKVASFLSFIDFYAPSYCMLENVVSMTKDIGPNRTDNVFAQILATLVGLGYQVRQFLMDAGALASAENRARVIIVAAAPGLEPLSRPPTTHAYPTFRKKALGKTSNGISFGERQDEVTPFQSVSASAATADLPDVGDSQPQLCPSFPDHRTPVEECSKNRNRIACVPKRPHGMGIVQAGRQGLLTGEPLDFFRSIERHCHQGAKSYARIIPTEQFPTITTVCRPRCYQTGRALHWEQDRPMTVMEFRRAQGYPDYEVILGTPGEQVRIIGNGVNRYVGLALGLVLRDSWINSDMSVRDRVQCLAAPQEYVSDSGYDERVSASPGGDSSSSMGQGKTTMEATSTSRAGYVRTTPFQGMDDEEVGDNTIVPPSALAEDEDPRKWTVTVNKPYILI